MLRGDKTGRGALSTLLLPSGALVSLVAQWEPCLDPAAPVCSVPPHCGGGQGPEAWGPCVHSLAARLWERGLAYS